MLLMTFIYYYSILFFLECRANLYCNSKYCNNSKEHTLCKFQASGPASHCVAYEKIITNDNIIQAILDKLNSRRNKVAAGEIRSLPSAASMMKLVWNAELEMSAQRWADQCVAHRTPDLQDTCRDLGALSVGQNIATVHGDAPGLTPMSLVDVWYMELLNINSSVLSRYISSLGTNQNHYDYFTQLIWEDSHQVGCGGVKFKEPLENEDSVKYRTIYRLACNFAPRGNRLNKTVYAIGEPCSRCPYEGLCDTVYKSLCVHGSKNTREVYTEDDVTYDPTEASTSVIQNTVEHTSNTPFMDENEELVDEIFNPGHKTKSTLDYFSNIYPIVKHKSATSQSVSCKHVMAVDDLFELLKKKIRDDKEIKDLLTSTTTLSSNESSYNNQAVAAFLSRIYSKKSTPTTRSTVPGDVNSTLLVDLIEAVIFRSSVKGVETDEYHNMNTATTSAVEPVIMQAELAEVKRNDEFSGHYFFPEDEEEKIERITENYYDNTLPASDIMIEMENIKMSTNDFLDDILESDNFAETTTMLNSISPDHIMLYTSGYNVMKNFLHNIAEKSHEQHDHS